MFLNDFSESMTLSSISKFIREHFNYEMPLKDLSEDKAEAILADLSKKINAIRQSDEYHMTESNRNYLAMLYASRYLTEYLMEKDPSRIVRNPNAYHAGSKRALGHAADTGVKFVPHVAGSALGAFVGGLKGQALTSDAGRIKVATHEIEQELSKINPKSDQSVQRFVSSQMKQHFGEYKNPMTIKAISTYMTTLYKAGVARTPKTPDSVREDLLKMEGNPFQNVNPDEMKKVVAYFMNIYKGGMAITQKAGQAANVAPRPTHTDPVKAKVANDVYSALLNLGYTKQIAKTAVMRTMQNMSGLALNFDQLFRQAQKEISQ